MLDGDEQGNNLPFSKEILVPIMVIDHSLQLFGDLLHSHCPLPPNAHTYLLGRDRLSWCLLSVYVKQDNVFTLPHLHRKLGKGQIAKSTLPLWLTRGKKRFGINHNQSSKCSSPCVGRITLAHSPSHSFLQGTMQWRTDLLFRSTSSSSFFPLGYSLSSTVRVS